MSLRHAMPVAELWDGEMQACELEGRRLLVLKHKGVVHAYEDRCAHQGVPLSKGELSGGVLTCSAHHWQYDVETGRGVNPASACLRRFPVLIRNGDVLVDLDVVKS